ncbi:MAG: extracellular solute-binding protein, partial [Pseudomonas sp.]|nr:extracellular solute-binding protein [Pseudomonas sp.]
MRVAIGVLCVGLGLTAQAAEQQVNIYTWSAYLPEQALQRFKDETGIAVKYDIFDSAEALDSKLLTGASGYDVVFPAASGLARAIKAGAVQPIEHTHLHNFANLDPEMLGKLASADPGNQYGVPYTWGTVGLGIN